MDGWLGITQHGYSAGTREMACRAGIHEAFGPGGENLKRMAQIGIGESALRELVEREGRRAHAAIQAGRYGPDWTSQDCVDKTLITGADGVMVPLVTEEQKKKRRATEAKKRQEQGRSSTARAGRPKKGSDGPYEEFKLVSYYDTDKTHSYAVGTSGDCHALGKLMRREAAKLKIDQAARTYSVTDGAPWILRQYKKQLPMVTTNILDYYHLREHVKLTAWTLYGEGSARAKTWQEDMMEQVWERGSLAMLEKLGHYLSHYHSGPKAQALRSLRDYVAPRVAMTNYPAYRELGYDCGSGPTESFCGTLTARLKGRGMHWDKDNAESMMALSSLYYSNLWHHYWHHQRSAA